MTQGGKHLREQRHVQPKRVICSANSMTVELTGGNISEKQNLNGFITHLCVKWQTQKFIKM